MPKREEFEIEIDKSGETKVHLKGIKGKACLEYAKFLEEIIGKIKSQELTSEYYEPGFDVEIKDTLHQKITPDE
jgi:hypothetical protein